jgi:hypothetical protein
MFSNNCQIRSQSKLLNQDVVLSDQLFSISCIGEFSYPESIGQSDIIVNLVVEGKIGSAIFWEVVGIVVIPLEERIGGSLRSEKPICLFFFLKMLNSNTI